MSTLLSPQPPVGRALGFAAWEALRQVAEELQGQVDPKGDREAQINLPEWRSASDQWRIEKALRAVGIEVTFCEWNTGGCWVCMRPAPSAAK